MAKGVASNKKLLKLPILNHPTVRHLTVRHLTAVVLAESHTKFIWGLLASCKKGLASTALTKLIRQRVIMANNIGIACDTDMLQRQPQL